MALKRIAQERADLLRDPTESCSVGSANDSDPRYWVATVAGPPDTPYAQGIFSANIRFPENYPSESLHVTFTTPIFHPNVSVEGDVQLDELEKKYWSPAFTVRSILLSIQALLSDPDPLKSGALNDEAAKLYLNDLEKFKEKAQQWTTTYASSNAATLDE